MHRLQLKPEESLFGLARRSPEAPPLPTKTVQRTPETLTLRPEAQNETLDSKPQGQGLNLHSKPRKQELPSPPGPTALLPVDGGACYHGFGDFVEW